MTHMTSPFNPRARKSARCRVEDTLALALTRCHVIERHTMRVIFNYILCRDALMSLRHSSPDFQGNHYRPDLFPWNDWVFKLAHFVIWLGVNGVQWQQLHFKVPSFFPVDTLPTSVVSASASVSARARASARSRSRLPPEAKRKRRSWRSSRIAPSQH